MVTIMNAVGDSTMTEDLKSRCLDVCELLKIHQSNIEWIAVYEHRINVVAKAASYMITDRIGGGWRVFVDDSTGQEINPEISDKLNSFFTDLHLICNHNLN